jgi:hypothetical protein
LHEASSHIHIITNVHHSGIEEQQQASLVEKMQQEEQQQMERARANARVIIHAHRENIQKKIVELQEEEEEK